MDKTDKEAFAEEIYSVDYPSWVVKVAKKHFNKHDCNLLGWRFDNSLILMVTNDPGSDEFRVVFSFKVSNARSDRLRRDFVRLFEETMDAKKLFEKKSLKGRSNLIADKDQTIEVDGVEVPVEEGQRVVVVGGDES